MLDIERNDIKRHGERFNTPGELHSIPEQLNLPEHDISRNIPTPESYINQNKPQGTNFDHTKHIQELNQQNLSEHQKLYREYILECSNYLKTIQMQKLDILDQARISEIKLQLSHLSTNPRDLEEYKKTVQELKLIQENLNQMLQKDEKISERIRELEVRIEYLDTEIKKLSREYEALYESHFSRFHNSSLDFRTEKTTLKIEPNLGGRIVIGSPKILEDGRCVYDIENILDNKIYRIILNERIPACDDDGIIVTLGSETNEFFDKDKGLRMVEIEGSVNHIDHTNQLRITSLVDERETLKEELKQLNNQH
jgi:hypothetical protein